MINSATESSTATCSICLKGYPNKKKMVITNCNHAFHEKCVTTWLDSKKHLPEEQNCPLCREYPISLSRALEGKAGKIEKNRYIESRFELAIRENNVEGLKDQLKKNPSLASTLICSSACGTLFTPLGTAASYGNIEVMKALIEAGADINGTDTENCTALMLAARSGRENAVDELLQLNANVHIRDKEGYNCVFLVNRNPNNLSIIKKLVAKKADIHVTSKRGVTPLIVAASHGDLDLVRFFHTEGIDLNQRGKSKLTALMKAVKNDHTQVAKYLLEADADPNLRDKFKQSALLFAVCNHNMEITEALLKHKADANLKTAKGLTPLYIAARDGLTSFVDMLLKHNADPSIGYKSHFLAPPEMPEEVAEESGYREIVELLTSTRSS